MKTWLRLALITMTVGGGFTGIVLTLGLLFHSEDPGLLHLVLIIVFLALYIFVVASGLLFVCDPQRTRPLLAALAVQVPWISTPLIVYKFAAGLHTVVAVGPAQEPGNIGIHLRGEY